MLRFLPNRNPDLTEWMDRPDADPELLSNTYRQFSVINRLLSGWKTIYQREIRPTARELNRPVRILDIGCGGGDILFALHQMCKKDGIVAELTGIDPDKRSIDFASGRVSDGAIRFFHQTASEHAFEQASELATELANSGERYDYVISNHLLHHLQDEEVRKLASDACDLALHQVIFNDISRSAIGYLLFQVTTPLLFRRSFISKDGLISIRRSFTRDELAQLLGEKWSVRPMVPFRLLAVYSRKGETRQDSLHTGGTTRATIGETTPATTGETAPATTGQTTGGTIP